MYRRAVENSGPPPLPLLITGVAGVAGYNALAYFQAPLSGPGDRHSPARQLAARRAGHRGLQCRGSPTAWPSCSTSIASPRCSIAPAIAPASLRARSGDGLADQRRRGAQPGRSGAPARRAPGAPVDRPGVFGHARRQSRRRRSDRSRSPCTARRWSRPNELIAERCRRPASLRISLPMGVSFNGHAGAIDWIQSRFKKSKPATLYFDEVRTPTYTDCLNRAVRDRAGRRAGGPVSRRRAAAAEPVPDRADRQSRRRLRSAPPDGLSAHRGRAHSAAGRQRLDGLEQAGPALGYEPFHAWPYDERWCRRTATGTSSGPPTSPAARTGWPTCCIAIRGAARRRCQRRLKVTWVPRGQASTRPCDRREDCCDARRDPATQHQTPTAR